MNANPLAQAQLGEEPMRTLERRVVISVVDRLWREHLYEMDYLKEGIGLRAMGQRDPLVEYKDEGAQMFQAMVERIREESVQQVFSYAKQFERALLPPRKRQAARSLARPWPRRRAPGPLLWKMQNPASRKWPPPNPPLLRRRVEAVAHARSVDG